VDVVVAGTKDAILMVEGGSVEVPEMDILEALKVAHKGIKELIAIQEELLQGHTVPDMAWTPIQPDEHLSKRVSELADQRVEEALSLPDKLDRQQAMASLREDVMASLLEEAETWREHEA